MNSGMPPSAPRNNCLAVAPCSAIASTVLSLGEGREGSHVAAGTCERAPFSKVSRTYSFRPGRPAAGVPEICSWTSPRRGCWSPRSASPRRGARAVQARKHARRPRHAARPPRFRRRVCGGRGQRASVASAPFQRGAAERGVEPRRIQEDEREVSNAPRGPYCHSVGLLPRRRGALEPWQPLTWERTALRVRARPARRGR
jgi:hypothetical protein